MKRFTRVMVFRDDDGNDIVREWQIVKYDTIEEATFGEGEQYVLSTFNHAQEQRERQIMRDQTAQEIRAKRSFAGK